MKKENDNEEGKKNEMTMTKKKKRLYTMKNYYMTIVE